MEGDMMSEKEVAAIISLFDLIEGLPDVDSGQVVVCKVAGDMWCYQEQGCDTVEILDQITLGEEPTPTCPRCRKSLRRSGNIFYKCNCAN